MSSEYTIHYFNRKYLTLTLKLIPKLSLSYSLKGRFLVQETFPKTLPLFVLILISLRRWQHRARKETKHSDWSPITSAAQMEVSLPQTMLQKLLDLSKLESFEFCLKIHIHVIRHIRCQVNIDCHNQHESVALIGLFHATSSVLPSVESYPNYQKPTQRGVQG